MPAFFIGHGNPTNAIEESVYAAAWRDAAASIPRPIHDFYGFPDALYQVQYPAPGSPELAERMRSLVGSTAVRLDDGYSWGLDHGVWSVLRRMYPDFTEGLTLGSISMCSLRIG